MSIAALKDMTADEILASCNIDPAALSFDVEKKAQETPAKKAEVNLDEMEKFAQQLEYAAVNEHGEALTKQAADELVEKTAEIEVIAATMKEIGLVEENVLPEIEKRAALIGAAMFEGHSQDAIAEFLARGGKQ